MVLVFPHAQVHSSQITILVNASLVQQVVSSAQAQLHAINAHKINTYSKEDAILNAQVEQYLRHKK